LKCKVGKSRGQRGEKKKRGEGEPRGQKRRERWGGVKSKGWRKGVKAGRKAMGGVNEFSLRP